MSKKAEKLVKDKFTLEVNYSDEAEEKKLMRFTTPSGDSFEISAGEMSTILIGQVNSDLVEATFVESDRVNVVEVTRQVRVRAERDIKKGEEIRLDYTHPYPIEFAVIEEAMKIAKIKMDIPVFTLTADYIKEVQRKTTKEQIKFVDLIYKFFRGLYSKDRAKKAASSP